MAARFPCLSLARGGLGGALARCAALFFAAPAALELVDAGELAAALRAPLQ